MESSYNASLVKEDLSKATVKVNRYQEPSHLLTHSMCVRHIEIALAKEHRFFIMRLLEAEQGLTSLPLALQVRLLLHSTCRHFNHSRNVCLHTGDAAILSLFKTKGT